MSTVTHFTLKQYERMIEGGVFADSNQRVELIHGEIRNMSPMGLRHAAAVTWLNEWSFQVVPRDTTIVQCQSRMQLPELESEPEPDLAWANRRKYLDRPPRPEDIELLIEVADSSRGFDLGEKAQLYAAAGIRDYWVVDLVDDCIHVFRDPRPSGYASRQVQRGDEHIAPLASDSAALTPRELFAATHD